MVLVSLNVLTPTLLCTGSLGNLFLANYNDSSHVTSDVCFVFQDGIVLYASRALLVTCSPQMIQLLYHTTGIWSCIALPYHISCSSQLKYFVGKKFLIMEFTTDFIDIVSRRK